MMDIKDFLLARIAEDEEVARAAIDPSGWGSSPGGRWRLEQVPYEGEWPRNPEADDFIWADSNWALHATRHDPARVLAECAAKRGIVGSYESCAAVTAKETHPGVKLTSSGMTVGLELGMKSLAAVYSDHPDYQEEWKVG